MPVSNREMKQEVNVLTLNFREIANRTGLKQKIKKLNMLDMCMTKEQFDISDFYTGFQHLTGSLGLLL